MKIGDIEFIASVSEILEEMRNELKANRIPLLEKQPIDGPSNVQIQCPYHSNGRERRPSAGIKKSSGVFHCFACGETHSLPELISYCFGYNDSGSFGLEWLLKNFLSISKEERREIELDYSRDNSSDISTHHNQYVTEDELDDYRYYHPYLAERGIVDENIIELFDLGYDKKTKCITFPVRDREGNCLFIARRNVHTKFFQYPKDVKKPLYGLYELHQVSQQPYHINITEKGHMPGLYNIPDIIVCESMIDCILLWQAGYYAVALNGLGNELQMNQLKDLPCRHLILATDNDEAGDRARDRIHKRVDNKLISEIVFPSNRKDIGECTPEEIKSILEWEEYV